MSPWVIQKTCDQEIYGCSNSLSGILHILFYELEYICWSHNKGICNSKIENVILIVDTTIILDYDH